MKVISCRAFYAQDGIYKIRNAFTSALLLLFFWTFTSVASAEQFLTAVQLKKLYSHSVVYMNNNQYWYNNDGTYLIVLSRGSTIDRPEQKWGVDAKENKVWRTGTRRGSPFKYAWKVSKVAGENGVYLEHRSNGKIAEFKIERR